MNMIPPSDGFYQFDILSQKRKICHKEISKLVDLIAQPRP